MSALSDDEQLDSLKSFAKKYGSAMISGILIALIAFFGWEYWQKKNLAARKLQPKRNPPVHRKLRPAPNRAKRKQL